jgi:RimJ/RimL family protein N-acetyltransferase
VGTWQGGGVPLSPTYPVPTARLDLSPLVPADVDDLLAYRGRADVCRYLPFDPNTREGLLHRMSGDLARRELTAEGQGLTLGVRVRETGRLVGDVVLFYRSEPHAGGEIGYVFHPDVAGRGYATEAAAAVLGLAFDGLRLNRVVARLDARNEPSARLAARLGMRQEAHFVRNELYRGEWTDELVFALLADEWRHAAR